MFADTVLLMRLNLQLSWNGLLARNRVRQIFLVAVSVVVGSLVASAALAVGFAAAAVATRFPEFAIAELLPGLLLTLATLILLLGAFGTSLSSLYLSRDMEMLTAAPVDRRAVFISKILGGLWLNYLIILVTALPALIGFGAGMTYGPAYYVVLALLLVGVPLFPDGLGALLVMLVARVAPANRIREALAVMGALIGLSFAVLAQSFRFWFQSVAGVFQTPGALSQLATDLERVPLPSLVAGRGLVAAGTGDWAGAVVGLAGFFAITFGFFVACVLVADRVYMAGWVRMQGGATGKRSAAAAARAAERSGWLGRSSASFAITLKDWRLIPRDLRQFVQILGPLVLLPVLYFNVLGGGGNRSFNAISTVEGLSGGLIDPTNVFVAMGILLGTGLMFGQLAVTGISMEGRAWWLLKTAPLSASDILRGKFLVAFVPFAVLSSVLMLTAAIARGMSIPGFLYGWFGVELLGAGIVILALGLGVPWAKFDWDNPKQMSNSWSTLFWFVSYAIYGTVAGGLLALPLLAQALAPELVLLAGAAGLVAATSLTAVIGAACFAIARDALFRVGEG